MRVAAGVGAMTSGAALSPLIPDIDRVKAINDGWGHSSGDAVLRLVAYTLREALGTAVAG